MRTLVVLAVLACGSWQLSAQQEKAWVYFPALHQAFVGSELEELGLGEFKLHQSEEVSIEDFSRRGRTKDYMGKVIRAKIEAGALNISCDDTPDVICFKTPEPAEEEEEESQKVAYIYDGNHTVVTADQMTVEGTSVTATGNVQISSNPELGAQLEMAESSVPIFRWKVIVGTFTQITPIGENSYRIECINSPDNCVFIFLDI